MKQTAVEWLEKAIALYVERCSLQKEFEQAKEMEKQQIIDAMDKFKNLHIHAVRSNEVNLFCRLHSMRKNCLEYRNNKNS